MILPNLEYCCAVFHGCGKGNEEELERLQSRAARIVLTDGTFVHARYGFQSSLGPS